MYLVFSVNFACNADRLCGEAFRHDFIRALGILLDGIARKYGIPDPHQNIVDAIKLHVVDPPRLHVLQDAVFPQSPI